MPPMDALFRSSGTHVLKKKHESKKDVTKYVSLERKTIVLILYCIVLKSCLELHGPSMFAVKAKIYGLHGPSIFAVKAKIY